MKIKNGIYFILVILLSLTGCGYQDMNKVNFVALTVLDEDENSNVIYYNEMFVGYRGTTTQGAESRRILLKGEGLTINQAFYLVQKSSTYPMAYDVEKAFAFTERLARNGVREHLDTILRNQKPTIKQFIFILESDPEEFLTTEISDEQFIGIYLEDTMIFQGDQPEILPIRLNEFMNERIETGRISVIPTIGIVEHPEGNRIAITGAAIIKDDKMVSKLSEIEVGTFKMLSDEMKAGNITVENPEEHGKYLSLQVLKSKTKKDIEYDGEDIILNVKINMDTAAMGIEGKIDIIKDQDKIIHAASKEIEKRCKDLFYKYQDKNIDILHVEEEFRRKFPHVQMTNILEDADIHLEVMVDIDSGQHLTDFEE